MARAWLKKGTQFGSPAQRAANRRDVMRGTHGTVMGDEGQTHVEPSSVAGVKPVFGISDKTKAYYSSYPKGTEAEHEATWGAYPRPYFSGAETPEKAGWTWAESARYSGPRGEGGIMPRRVVHEVVPEGEINVDKNMNETGERSEMVADRLKITDTHWIPPPSGPNTVMQGTLPHVNWNQFGGGDMAELNWHEHGESGSFESLSDSSSEKVAKPPADPTPDHPRLF